MAAKAWNINTLFKALAIIDIPVNGTGAPELYTDVPAYKTSKNLVDDLQHVLWPMLRLGETEYRYSSQFAALIQWTTHHKGNDIPCLLYTSMERMQNYERGTVPKEALMLTAAVDVQKDHFWWSVRAWGEHMTSWLVDYGGGPGICETWIEIEDVLEREYQQEETGESFRIYFALIDAGYRTEEVYAFCLEHPGLTAPSKGLDETSSKGCLLYTSRCV